MNSQVQFRSIFVATLLAVTLAIGCGTKSKVDRLAISGQVTYKGQPVPAGFICFSPDSKKGNRGPQGVARIINGRYDTKSNGKGSVQGPQIVEIRGFEAHQSPTGDTLPNATGPPLFSPYMTEIDIQGDMTDVDFEVPEGPAS